MYIEHEIQALAPSLRFVREEHAQLVRFIPLLAMIWADGEQQPDEVALFHSFVDRFVVSWLPSMSLEEARVFFSPYLQDRLTPAQHQELVRVFHYLVNHFGQRLTDDRKLDLYHLCQEIAQASRKSMRNTLGLDENTPMCISTDEQVLLLEMIHALNLHPEVKHSLFAKRSERLFELAHKHPAPAHAVG